MLEVAIPLELVGKARNFRVSVNSGSPEGSDYLEKGPVIAGGTDEFPKYPPAVWVPR